MVELHDRMSYGGELLECLDNSVVALRSLSLSSTAGRDARVQPNSESLFHSKVVFALDVTSRCFLRHRKSSTVLKFTAL